jgi:uncharacterized protein YndB with AHSA1/START domain
MNNNDLHFSFTVSQPPAEVFHAITRVDAWWTEHIEGRSAQLNDEFAVQFADMHYSKQKLVEVVPGQKIVWLVTDSQLNWLKNKDEWTNTRVIFGITLEGDKTKLSFTHTGLTPAVECYDGCSNAWQQYVCSSLFRLITTGEGMPQKK